MKLNGWQRLWAVLSGLWVAFVAVAVFAWLLQLNNDLRRARASFANDISVLDKYGCVAVPSFSFRDPPSWRARAIANIRHRGLEPCDESADTSYTSVEAEQNQEKFLENAIRRYMSDTKSRWAKHYEFLFGVNNPSIEMAIHKRNSTLFYGAAAAVLPPMALYVLGLAFAWIRAGFRGGHP
jgi:hypothetical protein